MKYDVTVGIVNYNNYEEARQAIRSLLENTRGVTLKIYVIDNASSDKSAQRLAEDFSAVDIILSDKNLGYGTANNLVLDKIDSEYHVVANPDILLRGDVLADLYAYMQANPDVALCVPGVRFMDGREQCLPKRTPKLKYMVANRLPGKRMRALSDYYKMKDADLNQVTDVEFASGCFMFCRTALFKAVGGFDPRYFLYLEDADLSRSIRKYGRVVYYPYTHVYHNYRRASAKSARYLFIHVMSMLKYTLKWRKEQRHEAKRMKEEAIS